MDDKALIQQWMARRPGQSRNLKTDGTYLFTRGNIVIGVHVVGRPRHKDPEVDKLIADAPMEPMILVHKPDGKEGATALRQYAAAWRIMRSLGLPVKEVDTPLPDPSEAVVEESEPEGKSMHGDV